MFTIKEENNYYVVYLDGHKIGKHRCDINNLDDLKKFYKIADKGVNN